MTINIYEVIRKEIFFVTRKETVEAANKIIALAEKQGRAVYAVQLRKDRYYPICQTSTAYAACQNLK